MLTHTSYMHQSIFSWGLVALIVFQEPNNRMYRPLKNPETAEFTYSAVNWQQLAMRSYPGDEQKRKVDGVLGSQKKVTWEVHLSCSVFETYHSEPQI